MNKNDQTLIGCIIIICLLFIVTLNHSDHNVAVVYYKNEIIKKIDLSLDDIKEYQVNGENGIVTLEVNRGRIRVKDENSPLHLCSKQGYISKSTESIVCLPNKIVIQIEQNNNIDTVVK